METTSTFGASSPWSVFLPNCVRELLADGEKQLKPAVRRFNGAIMFVDIVGFSTLTEQFNLQGTRGAETLTGLVDKQLGAVAKIVDEAGGDIISYAGDSIVVVWPEAEVKPHNVHVAAWCAEEIRSRVPVKIPDLGVTLDRRIVIDTGELSLIIVGSEKWYAILVGDPVRRIGTLYNAIEPGEIALSKSAWSSIADKVTGKEANQYLTMETVTAAPILGENINTQNSTTEHLQAFIPDFVVGHLSAGQSKWFSEFRTVTLVFITLHNFDAGHDVAPNRLQKIVATVQSTAHHTEGNLFQLLADDKGIVLLLAYGLPPRAHKNDAVHAISAALELKDKLKNQSETATIAVTTGTMLCAVMGEIRRQYSLFGPAVNLAAQMSGISTNDVLCDDVTMRNSAGDVMFTEFDTIARKGGGTPVTLFKPAFIRSFSDHYIQKPIVGREAERNQLQERLHRLQRRQQGGIVVITGEPGIGKSRLLSDLQQTAESESISTTFATARSIEASTPYFVFRSILQSLRDHHSTGGNHALTDIFTSLTEGDDRFQSWLPLLSDILPLDFAPNTFSSNIRGQARTDAIRYLIVRMLSRLSQLRPLLLIVDDAQWLDPTSAFVLRSIAKRCNNILTVIASRPLQSSARRDIIDLISVDEAEKLKLGPLSSHDTSDLIGQQFAVAHTDPELDQFIHSQTGGNPLYAEELALALRDAGYIAMGQEQCRLTVDSTSLDKSSLRENIQATIASRIDLLSLDAQIALKAASAVGSHFDATFLTEIAGLPENVDEIEATLFFLREQGLLVKVPGEIIQYDFRHVIVRETVYNMMLFTQRRNLHEAIAQWIEKEQADNLEPSYASLANHWESAENWNSAIHYLELAGKYAINRYANEAAIDHFNRALALTSAHNLVIPPYRQSDWERYLGDAHHELAEHAMAADHYYVAMRLLDKPVPDTKLALIFDLVIQIAEQTGRRRGWVRSRSHDNQARADAAASSIYLHLAEKAYFDNVPLKVLHATLSTLNLAERCHSVRELVSGYGALAIGLATADQPKLAQYYSSESLNLAKREGQVSDEAYAQLLAVVFGNHLGKWDLVETAANRARMLFLQLGDDNRRLGALVGLLHGYFVAGRIEQAREVFTEMSQVTELGGQNKFAFWLLSCRIYLDLFDAKVSQDQLTELSAYQNIRLDPSDDIVRLGLVALMRLKLNQSDAAITASQAVIAALKARTPTISGASAIAVTAPAEVYLTLAEAASEEGKPTHDLVSRAKGACKVLKPYAQKVPVARPRLTMLHARSDWLSGHSGKATRGWQRALQQAQFFSMPYETAQAHMHLGFKGPNEERKAHLSAACDIFTRLGAVREQQITQAARRTQ